MTLATTGADNTPNPNQHAEEVIPILAGEIDGILGRLAEAEKHIAALQEKIAKMRFA